MLCRSRLAWLAAGLALTVVASSAKAELTAKRKVQIDYLAPGEGCPPRSVLIDGVSARSRRLETVEDPATAETSVSVRIDEARDQAELVFRNGRTGSLTRSVQGKTCSEIVDGAALIIALTLDPTTADRGGLPAATEAPERPAAGANVDAAKNRLAAAENSSQRTPGTRPLARSHPASQPSAREQRRKASLSWHGLLGLGAGVVSGVSPDELAPGVMLSAGLVPRTQQLWAPALFGEAELAMGSSLPTGTRSARFTRVLARALACPVAVELPLASALRLCADLELGVLDGVGQRTARALWFGPGATLKLEVWPAQRTAVSVEGTISRPLYPDRFRYSGQLVHEIPELAWGLAAGVAFSVP